MSNFDKAFEHVVGVEGGYVNDPRDPGGETKYGISKRSYPNINIIGLTIDNAKQIYRDDFWNVVHGDDLPWPLAYFVFDAAVNQGVDPAKKLLQKALGVAQDGVLGKVTMGALRRADQAELCAVFMADRAMRYIGTRNFDVYGRGWFKRLFKIAMEV